MSAAAIAGSVVEEKTFCSFPGRVQMANAGMSREICVSLPDGAGAVGVDSEGVVDFAAQQGICAQQSGCLPIVARQQSGNEAAASAGAICAHTSIKLNQMAIVCFTTGSLCPQYIVRLLSIFKPNLFRVAQGFSQAGGRCSAFAEISGRSYGRISPSSTSVRWATERS
jgi:hypothetical protein